jgi:hypothetical protein
LVPPDVQQVRISGEVRRLDNNLAAAAALVPPDVQRVRIFDEFPRLQDNVATTAKLRPHSADTSSAMYVSMCVYLKNRSSRFIHLKYRPKAARPAR